MAFLALCAAFTAWEVQVTARAFSCPQIENLRKFCKKFRKNLHISKKKCNFAVAKLKPTNMDYIVMKERLRSIAEKPAEMLTAEDKAYVRNTAAELGVQFSAGKSRCKACYIDAAILCFSAAKTKEAEEIAESDDRRYILKPGVDVYFGSTRVNEATLTDELAERILARGFASDYFVKLQATDW